MKNSRAGFSTVELITAAAIVGIISSVALSVFLYATENVAAGRFQVKYNADARYVTQKIFQLIYRCNRLSPPVVDDGNSVRLFYKVNEDTLEEEARLEYVDLDGNPATQSDNQIRYDPDVTDTLVVGKEVVIVNNASKLPGLPVFSVSRYANGMASVKVQFHLGDNKQADYERLSSTGRGYQGVKVELTVAPRNLQESINWDQALGRQAAR